MAKQLLTPFATHCKLAFFIEKYCGSELFYLIAMVEKVELLSTLTTAVWEYWNVSDKYTTNDAADINLISAGGGLQVFPRHCHKYQPIDFKLFDFQILLSRHRPLHLLNLCTRKW